MCCQVLEREIEAGTSDMCYRLSHSQQLAKGSMRGSLLPRSDLTELNDRSDITVARKIMLVASTAEPIIRR